MKNKKKFKETRIGKFLTEKAPNLAGNILSIAGDITGVELLKNIGNKIRTSDELSETDKQLALKELDYDIQEAQEVTKRWEADMQSDSWLSKNVRPLVVLWLILFTSAMIVIDSIGSVDFTIAATWISLLSTLLVTVIVAYFGSRGYEKAKKIGKNK